MAKDLLIKAAPRCRLHVGRTMRLTTYDGLIPSDSGGMQKAERYYFKCPVPQCPAVESATNLPEYLKKGTVCSRCKKPTKMKRDSLSLPSIRCRRCTRIDNVRKNQLAKERRRKVRALARCTR